MNKVWFSEDGEKAYGDKSLISNEIEFMDLVREECWSETCENCHVENITEAVFIITTDSLEGEMCYPIKDSGISIKTLYTADIEYFDIC